MTERNLSTLYRRMLVEAASGPAGLLDADTLVAAAAGRLKDDRRNEVAARLSRSPAQTDLVRLLRELEPQSAALAASAAERQGHAHVRDARGYRHGHTARRHARRLRWVGLAACLSLVVGAVFWHAGIDKSDPSGAQMTAHSAVRPDRIFTSQDRIFSVTDERVVQGAVDGVFQSDFNGG
jgi:anti-sigma factor RsiW